MEERNDSQISVPDQLALLSGSSSSDGAVIELQKLLKGKQQRFKKSKKLDVSSQKTKKHYFTDGWKEDDGEIHDLPKESNPFKYPSDMEVFAHDIMTKAWRNDARVQELKKKCMMKLNHRGKQQKDVKKRIYVEKPPKDGMLTVLEVNPNYFQILSDSDREKLKVRDYIQTVQDSLRTKIVNGYREDDIMLLEENLIVEQQMINAIEDNYQKYVNIFEEFLYKDHTSAMQLLNDSDRATKEAYDKWEEYKLITKKLSAVRSALYISEERWRNCKVYQKFLYSVSPSSWKATQQRFRRASVFMLEDDDDEEDIFGKYRQSIQERGVSVEDILEVFRREAMNEMPPQLYFTKPEQLVEVFRFLEIQNLNALLHCEELAVPFNNVTLGMMTARLKFEEQIQHMQESVQHLQKSIMWEENRVTYLGKLAVSLIANEFKALVMDDEVLNLYVYVEDVYESKVGPNDANLSMLEMMTGVETKYRDELLFLDKVPSEEVAILEDKCYEEDVRVMRLAERAAKQYAELEKLNKRLKKAFAPAFEKPRGKQVVYRSPLNKPPAQIAIPHRSLTEREDEFLEYFTDFCRYTDDPKKYGVDTRINSSVDKMADIAEEWVENHFLNCLDGRSTLERVILNNTC